MSARRSWWMLGLGCFAAALFFGDGITPALSALGAIEGLELVDPHFVEREVSLALDVLAALFPIG
ncbi:MAG: KUP/HAK/KT family potassium transporter [Candidatus Competibacteraceae bacterium]